MIDVELLAFMTAIAQANSVKVEIDTQVSGESENPVQNKVIYNFVNSSVATNTAYFRGTYNSVAELEAYSGELTNNDYAFVISTDAAGNTVYNRYKYNGSAWVFEYALNNSSFTAEQWATIQSGLTAADKTQIGTNKENIATNTQNIATNTSNIADNTAAIALKANSADLGTAAAKDAPASGDAGASEVVLGNDTRLNNSRTPTAHTHAADEVTAMTGYSKPLTTSAISASDTLNGAVGKLEKGLDDVNTTIGTINSTLEEVL